MRRVTALLASLLVMIALNLSFAQENVTNEDSGRTPSLTSTLTVKFRAGQWLRCYYDSFEAGELKTIRVVMEIPEGGTVTASSMSAHVEPSSITIARSEPQQLDNGRFWYTIELLNHLEEQLNNVVFHEPQYLGAVLIEPDEDDVCINTSDVIDDLLISQTLPAGARYQLGSSRLDDLPITDPLANEDVDVLYWSVPYQTEGTLTYSIEHSQALAAMPETSLTLRSADREQNLLGERSFQEFEDASSIRSDLDLIRSPQPGGVVQPTGLNLVLKAKQTDTLSLRINDELVELATYELTSALSDFRLFEGIPLVLGPNKLVVSDGTVTEELEVFQADEASQLVIRPISVTADARKPITIEVLALDAAGFPSGSEFVTFETDLEPLEADELVTTSGYQRQLFNGRLTLSFEPKRSPSRVSITAATGSFLTTEHFNLTGSRSTLYGYQGSVNVQLGTDVDIQVFSQAYVEMPLGEGSFIGMVDAGARLNDFELDTERGLVAELDEDERFPLLAAGGEVQGGLRSDDGFAFRYDDTNLSVGYYADRLSVPGVNNLPRATALHAEGRTDDLNVAAFAALLAGDSETVRITPDGTRYYRLGLAFKRGSETVTLSTTEGEQVLLRNRDYTINYVTGVLTLDRPLWPNDVNFNDQYLKVTYSPVDAARDVLTYGLGADYRLGSVDFSVGFAQSQGIFGNDSATRQTQFGAALSYRENNVAVNAEYHEQLNESRSASLALSATETPLSATANLNYNDDLNDTLDGELSGQARLAVSDVVLPGATLALEHSARSTSNRTDLIYEQSLNQFLTELTTNSIIIGGGLGYAWESAVLNGILRAGYNDQGVALNVTHAQPFDFTVNPMTSFQGRYALNNNLDFSGGVSYLWTEDISGTLGFNQRLGDANLNVSYQLPTASGQGNRTRFGVDVPVALTENTSIDLYAGYEHALETGENQLAAGAAVQYSDERLTASLGAEVAVDEEQIKVAVRSGAAGELSPDQVLSFDANYQVLPEAEGNFTIAYALKRKTFQVLTYHRLTTLVEHQVLEGELAPTYSPNPYLQIRPAFAYRYGLEDENQTAYQLNLGANTYLENPLDFDELLDTFGVGAAGHYLHHAASETAQWGFSLEGSVQLVDQFWFTAGYTFLGFQGLTRNSRGGLYLQLDIVGGGQF